MLLAGDQVDDQVGNLSERANRASQAGAAGNALFGQGRFREAKVKFREAVALQPESPDLHYNLACAAWAVGEMQEVKSHLLWIVEQTPRFAKAHDALARYYYQLHDAAAALPYSVSAVRLVPNEEEFRLTHATVLESLGRYAEAWDAARSIVTSAALGDRATSLCARIAPKLGREAEAVNLIATALTGRRFIRPFAGSSISPLPRSLIAWGGTMKLSNRQPSHIK